MWKENSENDQIIPETKKIMKKCWHFQVIRCDQSIILQI